MVSYLAVDGAVLLEVIEVLRQDLVLGQLAADVLRVLVDAVRASDVIQTEDAVAGLVHLVEGVHQHLLPRGRHRRLARAGGGVASDDPTCTSALI